MKSISLIKFFTFSLCIFSLCIFSTVHGSGASVKPVWNSPILEKNTRYSNKTHYMSKNSLLDQLIREQKFRNNSHSRDSTSINLGINRTKEITPKNPLNTVMSPIFLRK